jgi:D-alanyl-D-alanine carboxypeptidase
LSDPISLYVDGVPSGEVVTLDVLGRMRSGLSDYAESDDFLKRIYGEAPAGLDAFSTTPRELIDWAFAQPINFPPGSQYEYSNTNTALLAMVVEKVSGLSLADYLQQNIFGPVGLTQTSFPANGRMPLPYAHWYNEAPDGTIVDATLWNPSWGYAAGQIVSPDADLKTWAAAVGTGALLSPGHSGTTLSGGTAVAPGVDHMFAIFNAEGGIGHNGDIPGYTTVMVYCRSATPHWW